MYVNKPPWFISGQTANGLFRIEAYHDLQAGIEFPHNLVALVPEKDDADLIVKLVNRFHSSVEFVILDENSGPKNVT